MPRHSLPCGLRWVLVGQPILSKLQYRYPLQHQQGVALEQLSQPMELMAVWLLSGLAKRTLHGLAGFCVA